MKHLVVLALLVLGVAGFVVRRRFILITVVGSSMEPTLRSGQRVLARRAADRGIQRRDIIVFRTPAHRAKDSPALRVKRVAATPGDPFPIWLADVQSSEALSLRVPDGALVVAGDNQLSEDSRQLGLVPTKDVIAVIKRFRTSS